MLYLGILVVNINMGCRGLCLFVGLNQDLIYQNRCWLIIYGINIGNIESIVSVISDVLAYIRLICIVYCVSDTSKSNTVYMIYFNTV